MKTEALSLLGQQNADLATSRRLAAWCGLAAILLGLLGLASWLTGAWIITRVYPQYIPMSPSTALAFLCQGVVLWLQAQGRLISRRRGVAIAVAGLVALWGLLGGVEYVAQAKIDLNLEDVLAALGYKFGLAWPTDISPITAVLFFLAGIGLLLLLKPITRRGAGQLVVMLGCLVAFSGFIGLIGYIFDTPLLYGGDIIPVAATTDLGFLVLGTGVAVAAGPGFYPFNLFFGRSTRTRLTRIFLPLVLLLILAQAMVHEFFTAVFPLPPPLVAALNVLIFIIITTVAVERAGTSIGEALDQTQVALGESEERYRTLVENIDLGISVIDRDHRIIMTNAAQGKLLQRPIDEFIGLTCFREFEKREEVCSHCPGTRTMATGQKHEFELTTARDDGSRLDVRIQTFPYRASDGSITGFIEVVEDITKRKRAEEELRQREQEYRSLVDNIPGFVFKGYPDYTVEFFDDKIEAFTGYAKEEFNSKRLKWSELIVQEDLQNAKAIFVQALKRDQQYAREYRLKKKEREIVWVQERSQILMDPGGAIDYVSGIFFDITGIKRAEDALRESQEKLNAILETTPAGIFLVNAEGNITFANQMMADLFAYRNDEILGTAYVDLVHPEERSIGSIKMKSLMTREVDHVSLERRYLAADGREFWGHLSGRCLLGADGGFVGLIGVIMDITARKRAEEELRLKEKLLDGASDSIFLHDRDGHFLYVNEAAYRDRGYTKEELLALRISALLTPELFDLRESLLKDLLPKGKITFESEHLRKDGSVLPVEIHARTIDLDHRTLLLSVARDISERKEAEKNLWKEKTLSDNIINSLPGVFYLFDETGRFLRWNKNFEYVTGYTSEEFTTLNPLDLFEGEAKKLIAEAIQEVFLKGENTVEADLFMKDGRKVPYFFTGRRIDLDGNPYLIGMGVDISARRRAEEELRSAAQKWRTTFDAIGDAVCLIDRDLKVTQCNQAMVDLADKPFSEIIGCTCWEVLTGTSEAPEGCACVQMVQSHRRETFTMPLGDRWLHAMAYPILDAAGQFAGGVYVIADITDYKQATQKIKDLNTLLSAIKDINEALLRVKNEKELFQQSCDLLAKVPYVRFTWIGLVQEDSFEVKPAAWGGIEAGYLSTIKVRWDDSSFGQGPTGSAIRTKQPVAIGDISIDSRFLPWREDALKRGYASSVSLPLLYGKETLGTLNVYSGNRHAFGKEELEFLNQVAGDIAVGVRSLRMEQDLIQGLINLQVGVLQTVEAIASMAEMRDPYTAGHQRGVTELACALGQELGLDANQIEGLRVAGFLHDIGKIVVPAEILNKPGKLSEFEMNLIKMHPQAAYDILKKINFPWPVAQIVVQHHERMNGSGYPQGLAGDKILLEARILAVADVVEAMAAHRPYRPSLGLAKALDEVAKHKGSLYDPEVAEACLKLFQEKRYTLA